MCLRKDKEVIGKSYLSAYKQTKNVAALGRQFRLDPWPQCCYLWVCILQGIVQSGSITTGLLSLCLCLTGDSAETIATVLLSLGLCLTGSVKSGPCSTGLLSLCFTVLISPLPASRLSFGCIPWDASLIHCFPFYS